MNTAAAQDQHRRDTKALPYVHLTPIQSCTLHGWLRPKRTLHWQDMCSNPALTIQGCLAAGLTHAQLHEMQPDVRMWIDAKGVGFKDVESMLAWPLHPIRDLKGNLSDLASMHYPPRVLVALGITYEYMRRVLRMDDSWMHILRYTPREWSQLGFTKDHASDMGKLRVQSVFFMEYDALVLMVAASSSSTGESAAKGDGAS